MATYVAHLLGVNGDIVPPKEMKKILQRVLSWAVVEQLASSQRETRRGAATTVQWIAAQWHSKSGAHARNADGQQKKQLAALMEHNLPRLIDEYNAVLSEKRQAHALGRHVGREARDAKANRTLRSLDQLLKLAGNKAVSKGVVPGAIFTCLKTALQVYIYKHRCCGFLISNSLLFTLQ